MSNEKNPVQPQPERDPNLKASVKIKSRIDKVADPQSSRYALGHVQVTPSGNDEVFLTATNGRVAVVMPAEGYVDEERLIPGNLLPRKLSKRIPHSVSLNGRWESSDGKFADEPEGRFPRVDDVFSYREHAKADVENQRLKWAGPSVTVKLDARYLMAIAEALNETENGLTLFIRANKDGFVDASVNVLGENGVAVIMPIRADKSDGERFDAMVKRYKKAKGGKAKNRAVEKPAPAAEQPQQVEEAQPAEEPSLAA